MVLIQSLLEVIEQHDHESRRFVKAFTLQEVNVVQQRDALCWHCVSGKKSLGSVVYLDVLARVLVDGGLLFHFRMPGFALRLLSRRFFPLTRALLTLKLFALLAIVSPLWSLMFLLGI